MMKRGLSELVAYVILITIALSLSAFVYSWMKCYIPGSCGEDLKECPEGAALVIKDYKCISSGGKSLNLTIQNKGLFSIDGFIIKINDRPGASIGVYTLKTSDGKMGKNLVPGEEVNYSISLISDVYNGEQVRALNGALTLIEVQPFVNQNVGSRTRNVFCERVSSQITDCFTGI